MRQLLLACSVLFITGCAPIAYQNVSSKPAVFPIEKFSPMGKYDIKNVGTRTENNVTYVILPAEDFNAFVQEYKHVKSEYNLLYNGVSTFNENLPQPE